MMTIMDITAAFILAIAFFGAALMYATVGHAGASCGHTCHHASYSAQVRHALAVVMVIASFKLILT